jgi:DNA-binding response OmpR family regulator
MVEHERHAASELTELLEYIGHRFATAHDIASARHLCDSFDPDWALVDVRLGGEAGLVLAREWGGDLRPRVILVSGLDAAPTLAPALPHPPPVMLKPFSLEQLNHIPASSPS